MTNLERKDMNYIDGFREPKAAAGMRKKIDELAHTLAQQNRVVQIMEVCGSHTMSIARYGIRDILPPNVRLISGPGCPVCVTTPGYIDTAIQLARQGVRIVSFGDMIAVPGSDISLAQCRAEGGTVDVCYSPAVTLELAAQNPDRDVVFLAIGFESTTAPVISLIPSAIERGVKNLSLLCAFKQVMPALNALIVDPDLRIDAFLCPAHVSAIIGSRAYEPLVAGAHVPCVIAGFEPLDILFGLQGILEQIVRGEARVENQYNRVVKPDGNLKAQALVERFLQPADVMWRGLGRVPGSGYTIRPEYRQFDTEARFGIAVPYGREHADCRCGDVIKGKMSPPDCPLFGTACTTDRPVGPCMVSAEGVCAAYYKYSRLGTAL